MLHGAALVLTLSLSACGGGGSGGGSNSPPPPGGPITKTLVDPTNYTVVAAHAYLARGALANASQTQASLVAGVSVQQPLPGVAALAMDLLEQAAADQASLATGVVKSMSCRDGGSLNMKSSAGSGALKVGDMTTIEVKDCTVSGVTSNGGFKATVQGINTAITPGATRTTTALEFASLSITSGKDTATIHGDMTVAITRGADVHNVVLSGNSLRITNQTNGAAVSDRTVHQFQIVTDNPDGTRSITSAYSLTGSSASISDLYVDVKSLQPFVRIGTGHPVSGSLLVSGGASSVKITAVDEQNVKLELSAKDDGVITTTRTLPWAEFQKAL